MNIHVHVYMHWSTCLLFQGVTSLLALIVFLSHDINIVNARGWITEIKKVFRLLALLAPFFFYIFFCDILTNPFCSFNTKITSSTFTQEKYPKHKAQVSKWCCCESLTQQDLQICNMESPTLPNITVLLFLKPMGLK